jgi:DNA-binding NarL/FixJ family response regulator
MMHQVTIAIAEDNPLAQKSILKKLGAFDDVSVLWQAGNGAALIENLHTQEAEIVLMDIEMPIMDGITATRKVKDLFPNIKILMLTTFDDDDKIFSAILAGASGYLLKDEAAANIHKAIWDVRSGGAAMSATIAWKTLNYIKSNTASSTFASEPNLLSEREIEVLTGLKNGLSYKLIANELYISEGTVRKHIENIYRKLHVNNKVSAINIAAAKKWL